MQTHIRLSPGVVLVAIMVLAVAAQESIVREVLMMKQHLYAARYGDLLKMLTKLLASAEEKANQPVPSAEEFRSAMRHASENGDVVHIAGDLDQFEVFYERGAWLDAAKLGRAIRLSVVSLQAQAPTSAEAMYAKEA